MFIFNFYVISCSQAMGYLNMALQLKVIQSPNFFRKHSLTGQDESPLRACQKLLDRALQLEPSNPFVLLECLLQPPKPAAEASGPATGATATGLPTLSSIEALGKRALQVLQRVIPKNSTKYFQSLYLTLFYNLGK